ncbi:hypothetical protein BGP_5537 [Beggiatoa sp. PS]|nr:hypothetical protein BGP_5537 [Beggiatoa sp. PS]
MAYFFGAPVRFKQKQYLKVHHYHHQPILLIQSKIHQTYWGKSSQVDSWLYEDNHPFFALVFLINGQLNDLYLYHR